MSGAGGRPNSADGIPAALPDIVIVGAQKAATSMLSAALREHPEVDFADGEFHGFADPGYQAGAVDRLPSLFHRDGVKRRGIKCASYLGHLEVPARLAADLDDPDIVVALRDPVERAVSAWFWHVRTGLVPLLPVNEALRYLLALTPGDVPPEWRHGPEILEWGRYTHLLEHWWEAIPRQRVHIVFDHDLRRDPAATVTGLYRSLGIDPGFVPTAQDRRHNDGIYSLRRLRWLRIRLRWVWQQDANGIWYSDRPRRPLPAAVNAAIVATDRYVWSRLDHPRAPALDRDLDAKLRGYYRDDIVHLQELLEVDLGPWLGEAARDLRSSDVAQSGS